MWLSLLDHYTIYLDDWLCPFNMTGCIWTSDITNTYFIWWKRFLWIQKEGWENSITGFTGVCHIRWIMFNQPQSLIMLVITVQANWATGTPRSLFLPQTHPHSHRVTVMSSETLCSLSLGLWLQSLVVSVSVQRAVLPGHRPVSGHLRGCGVDRPQSG